MNKSVKYAGDIEKACNFHLVPNINRFSGHEINSPTMFGFPPAPQKKQQKKNIIPSYHELISLFFE